MRNPIPNVLADCGPLSTSALAFRLVVKDDVDDEAADDDEGSDEDDGKEETASAVLEEFTDCCCSSCVEKDGTAFSDAFLRDLTTTDDGLQTSLPRSHLQDIHLPFGSILTALCLT